MKDKSENSESLFKSIGKFVVKNWGVIALAFMTFFASSAIVYFDANTTETIASFLLTILIQLKLKKAKK